MTHHVKDEVSIGHRLAVTILMGLLLVAVLNLSPMLFGISLVPDRLSFALQDLAQQLAVRISPSEPIRPAIKLIDMPLMPSPDEGYVSRAEVAHLLPILDRAGPAVIVLDIDLSRPSPADIKLMKAMADLQHAQIVIGLLPSPRQSGRCADRTDSDMPQPAGASQILWPFGRANQPWPRVWYGSFETEADDDGVYRSVCPFVTARTQGPQANGASPSDGMSTSKAIVFPSVALLSARLADSRHSSRATNAVNLRGPWLWRPGIRAFDSTNMNKMELEPRRIRFLGDGKPREKGGFPIASVTPLPLEMVTNGSDLSELRGSIIIIGSSSVLNQDESATPLGWMSGMTITANIVAGFAADQFLVAPTHLDYLLLECVLVIVGALVFILGNDALPRRIHRYVGESRWARLCATVIRILWLFIMVGIVTALMLVVQAWLAAGGIAAGVAVDPAVGIIAIFAERLIHFASVVEKQLSLLVAKVAKKLEKPRVDGREPAPDRQADGGAST